MVDKVFGNFFWGYSAEKRKKKMSTQLSGQRFVSPSKTEDWGSKTPKRIIELFWLRLVGDALLMKTI